MSEPLMTRERLEAIERGIHKAEQLRAATNETLMCDERDIRDLAAALKVAMEGLDSNWQSAVHTMLAPQCRKEIIDTVKAARKQIGINPEEK